MNTFVKKDSLFYQKWEYEYDKNLSIFDIYQKKYQKKYFPAIFPDSLHSPFLLKDIKKAIKRIKKAILKKEKIIIFGDYDVDGVSSISILVPALEKIGAKVSFRVPDRNTEGYSFKKKHLDEIKKTGTKLLITVDNGISAKKEIDYAKDLGIDVIITDHHQIPNNIPKAEAIINPQQKDCSYPNKFLCGAGVALKLAQALIYEYFGEKEALKFVLQNLDLLALATLCDCMPLLEENRAIAKLGIEKMKKTPHSGINLILKEMQTNLENINEETLLFQIGPRINASGRLKNAYYAIFTLLNKKNYAYLLEKLNEERKLNVKNIIKNLKIKNDKKIIINYSKDYLNGILGLISGKITETFNLPSIVFSEKEKEYTGSCRSIKGFNIYEFLVKYEKDLLHFGGHEQAAGLSISKKNFQKIKEKMENDSCEILNKIDLNKKLVISKNLSYQEIIDFNFDIYEKYAPYGEKYPKMIFSVSDIKNIEYEYFGKKSEHLKALVYFNNKKTLTFKKFFLADFLEKIKNYKIKEIAFTFKPNIFRGEKKLELFIEDLKFEEKF